MLSLNLDEPVKINFYLVAPRAMANTYRIVVLKGCLTIVFFVVNLFGLWPFTFVQANRQIRYSFIKATYSICLLICGIITYEIVGSIAFNGTNKAFFGSFTLRFVLLIYVQSILVSFAVANLCQHWFANEIENAYTKWVDLFNEMGESFCNIDLSGYIFGIVMRTIVAEVIQAAGSYTYMTNFESSTDIVVSRPYLVLFLQWPPYVARLQINVFYGIVLAIEIFSRIINTRLVDIVRKATESARYKHIEMCNYCNCSDEMDRLSMLQLKLTQATKSISSIFSINIVLWNMTIIVTLTVQLLNQFISIVELVLNDSNAALIFNVYGVLAIILATYDQLSMSNACQRLKNSAGQTSQILHSIKMSRDIDSRFRKIIDDFSMQMLLNNLKIGGMFTLDSRTATMVITTIVSYFVVLLQFELAERKMPVNLKNTS